ncbi:MULTISPECIES: hypothetical protein [Streptomyces]|uniref:hypothetical protein n=1 Tax=Streptomyces TaxID=1883 RepID=UPI0029B34CB3|nr:hypothetical protein [Streptomyces sp. WI03-4A]MDX2594599.1 hypothetical protein [Streptomyces sp. WI03-4A]
MSGRTDSGTEPAIAGTEGTDEAEETEGNQETGEADGSEDPADSVRGARRARWTALGTGALLSLAGLAAALLRLTGSEPALVPAAYALGAALCALAAVLGLRGRTRRALWLLVAGTTVMAVGDQFD